MNHDKCDKCMYSRPVLSENGWHPVCCLADRTAKNCLTGKRSKFVLREADRGVHEEMLNNIQLKIRYYEAAVEALRKVGDGK